MEDLGGPSDLGTHLFENFRGRWLAAPIPGFQQALKRPEIISGGGQPLAQLMAENRTCIGQRGRQSKGEARALVFEPLG